MLYAVQSLYQQDAGLNIVINAVKSYGTDKRLNISEKSGMSVEIYSLKNRIKSSVFTLENRKVIYFHSYPQKMAHKFLHFKMERNRIVRLRSIFLFGLSEIKQFTFSNGSVKIFL